MGKKGLIRKGARLFCAVLLWIGATGCVDGAKPAVRDGARTEAAAVRGTVERDAESSGRISQWIEQLSDEDFGTRENAARRLIEAGEEAVGALIALAEKGTDAEQMKRAEEILEEMGLAPPSLQREIDEAIQIIKKERNGRLWREGMGRLRVLGRWARKKYMEIRACSGGQGEVDLIYDEVDEFGLPVKATVRLTNTGGTGFWFDTMSLWLCYTLVPFHEKMTQNMHLIIERRTAIVRESGMNKEARYLYLDPGESFERTYDCGHWFRPLEDGRVWAGTVKIYALYRMQSDPERTMIMGGKEVPFPTQAQLDRGEEERIKKREDERWPSIRIDKGVSDMKTREHRILPRNVLEREKSPVVSGLQLQAALLGGKEATEGIPVRLTWKNRKEEVVHLPDMWNGERETMWYVVMDEKGEWMASGGIPGGIERRWKKAEADENKEVRGFRIAEGAGIPEGAAQERKWKQLRGGEECHLDVRIPFRGKTGKRYHVLVGIWEEIATEAETKLANFHRSNVQFNDQQKKGMISLYFPGGLPPETAWEGMIYSNAVLWQPK